MSDRENKKERFTQKLMGKTFLYLIAGTVTALLIILTYFLSS